MKFTLSKQENVCTKPSIAKFEVKNDLTFVHNVEDTSDESVQGYDSCLKYWEDVTGETAKTCFARDAHVNEDGTSSDINDVVGAHVRIDGIDCPEDEAWIVPLCKHCNSKDRTWTILLKRGAILLPVKMGNMHATASHRMDYWIKAMWRLNIGV